MHIKLFVRLSAALFLLHFTAFSQSLNDVPEKLRIHHEVPDNPYQPNASGNLKTTPGRHFSGTGFFTTQVNVDANGNNIVGDAANEPSIAVSPVDPTQIVIGWRQFATISSNFRQAGMGYSSDGGQNWKFPGPLDPATFRSDPIIDVDAAGKFYYNSLTSNNNVFTCKVFRSSNGGVSWDDGVDAHGGDKQWMTIDRSGTVGNGNIYSNWTYAYSSCPPGFMTRSTNGGDSYENCVIVDGSPYWGTLTVGNLGELYIAGSRW